MTITSQRVAAWCRYGVAPVVAGVVFGLRLAFGDTLGRQTPFALLGLGVLLAGWIGGVRGGLVTTFLLTFVSWYFFQVPGRAFAMPEANALLQLEILFVEGVAISLIVGAMERARSRQEEATRRLEAMQALEAVARRRLEALAQIGAALSGALSREEVARVVVAHGTAMMEADICTLYVVDDVDGSLELIADRGVAPEVLERIHRIAPSSENPSFESLASGRAIWSESPEDYVARYPRLATIKSDAPRAKAFWSMPLTVEGRPIGLLGMGFYQVRHFPLDERRFVETFAGHCAQALRRAQRLAAEQAARKSAERAEASLATTLRSIGDAVIATDKLGRITFMNPVAERLTGWTAAEARGTDLRAVFRIVNEDTREPQESPVDRVLKEGVVVGLANHTILLGRAPGHETAIDDSGAPIRDESGEIQGVVLVFRDVTEKKNQEARRAFIADATSALASTLDHQATLSRLAEMLTPRFADWCVIDVLDRNSSVPRRLAVAHVDPAKAQMARDLAEKYPEPVNGATGVPNVLRTGRSELYPEITPDMLMAGAHDEEHRRVLASLQLRSALIVPLRARGNTLGTLSLVFAESGRSYTVEDLVFIEDVAGRAAVVIDNAQLYASECDARVAADIANRTKDDFLATISHELRTPLNAILGWARLMAKAPQDETRRLRAVGVIERNAVSMARLIEDLLDVSRIVSGKVRLEVERVDLLRVIESAVDSVRPGFEGKDIKVRLPTPGDPVSVLGDANRIRQVLCNLLSNAVKFTGRGGQIDVRVVPDGASVDIEVQDSGKGIDAGFLPHVFDPFRQADGSITRAHGGLGLGLAISRHLVELHGGRIRAHSDGVGQGAIFVVTLPVGRTGYLHDDTQPTPELPREVDNGRQRPARLRGLRVLAVDDDSDARDLVRTVLEECGSIVRVAGTAADAMLAISEEVPDVLLSDIGMPGEDGYALIRRIRALPAARGGDVPAAALTAYTRAEDRRNVIGAGYTAHVAKPVEPTELIAVVAGLAAGTSR